MTTLLKPRVIVDLNNLAWRSYHANADLSTRPQPGKPPVPTGVVFGVIRGVNALANTLLPGQLICCADKGRSWRMDVMEGYKGNRAPKTAEEQARRDDFNRQFSIVKPILNSLAVPVVEWNQLEADDLISVIVHKIPTDAPTIVVSGDKDLLQLAAVPNTTILIPPKDARVTRANFLAYTRDVLKIKGGVSLEAWLLYRALVGDSSDELAGIPGVGPVSAAEAVRTHHTVQSLVEAIAKKEVKGKAFQSATRADLETQYNMHDLALVPGADDLMSEVIPYIENELKPRAKDYAALRDAFFKWEFHSLYSGSISANFKNIPSI